MATETEELQAKEFLKRAEIRTMRKDLLSLRESDAVKERDKIAKIKTLEEQLEEKRKNDLTVPTRPIANEKAKRDEVLLKNESQEIIAEKDLKNYATEEERQKIFLLESQRLAFEKQIDAIDKTRDPAVKLEKNKLLIQKREWQTKLNVILEQEKKLEGELKVITEQAQATNIPAQKKSLEQSTWDLDKKVQDIEKKRWEIEKQIEDVDKLISQQDKSSENLVLEKNGLRDKVLGVDKLLRDVYSTVMAREEEKRKGLAQYQISQKEALAQARTAQKETIQRQQWTNKSKGNIPPVSSDVPVPIKRNILKSFQNEEDQRQKFLQDVESLSENNNQKINKKWIKN